MRRYLAIALVLVALAGYWSALARAAESTPAPATMPPSAATPTDEATQALAQGMALYAAGKTEEALSVLRGFVINHYDSPQLPQAYTDLARIFLDQGQPAQALLYIDRISPKERSPATRLIEGAALVAKGDQVQQGLDLLAQLSPDALSPADRARRFSAQADGKARLGHPLEALVFLNEGTKGASDQVRLDFLHQAHDLLRDRLDQSQLAEAAFMFRGTAIGEDALLQQAERALDGGDRTRAEALVKGLITSTIPFPYRQEAVLFYDRLTGGHWLQRAIGIELPLSGRYAAFGELVRRGMDLALAVHNDSNPPVRFIYRDIGADPEQAAQAVSTLANEDRVMAIAGPLTGVAAVSAAAQAQQEQVPMLTLSQREGLPETGNYIFRDSLTSRLQAQTLARYAVEQRGITSFAILYPQNRLGDEMARLFTEEVEKLGGKVTEQQSYGDNDTDFRRPIKLLMGQNPDLPDSDQTPATEQEKLEDLFVPDPPPLDFQALFIPDYADRIGLIAPQLAFYGIENVQLLGINGWDTPKLIDAAGEYVEGAVFVDGFFRRSPYPFVQAFDNLYYDRYKEQPTILGAQGYDVANILLSLLDRPEIKTRAELREALSRVQDFPGVTGATSFNAQGEAEKELFLLRVKNGHIVQIMPQPASSPGGAAAPAAGGSPAAPN